MALLLGAIVGGAHLWGTRSAQADALNNTDFVITVDTNQPGSSTNTQFTIPTTGTGYDYTVDCDNDGVVDASNQTGSYTCNYPAPGTYKVRIGGTFPRIFFNNVGDKAKLTAVNQWGTNKWKDMTNAFWGAANMDILATDAPDLSEATSLRGMFDGATALKGETANWNWNTSTITDMSRMFLAAGQFNQPIGSWDTSNVTTTESMFTRAAAFNQPLNDWKMGKVTNISRMFQQATAFDQPLAGWDTGAVTNMSHTFSSASAFNQPIGTWNTANVQTMNNMFNNASRFNQPIGDWDTGNVTRTDSMFAVATAFNQPLNNWKTGKITNMDSMFSVARAFNQPLDNWNTAAVTNMTRMFNAASAFNQPLATWQVGALTQANQMFNTSGLSVPNYDATLMAWNTQAVRPGVTFGGGTSKYCRAEAARTNLTTAHTWVITDAGKDCAAYKPQSTTLSGGPAAVEENAAVGTDLGTLASTSPLGDADTFTYSLACDQAGPQNDLVEVAGTALRLKQSPDYEQTRELAVCVRVTNSVGQTFDQNLTIPVTNLYTVTYDGNGATGGTAPEAREAYAAGTTTPAAANTGNLERAGFTLVGWSPNADGGDPVYAVGAPVAVAGDMTLYAIWRDATAPAAPSAPVMHPDSDSGDSSNDAETNNTMPSFTVRCSEVGGRVTLYVDGQPNGSAACEAVGPLTLKVERALAEGDHTVAYTETDAHNNESPRSTATDVVIDTTAPAPTATLDDVTADNTLDATEATQSQQVSGTIEGARVDDEVTVTVNGKPHTVRLGADGKFSVEVAGADLAAAAGTLEVSLTTKDNAGNSATVRFNKQYTVAAAPAPANPANPVDPVQPADPNAPVDPANPTGQADQAGPTSVNPDGAAASDNQPAPEADSLADTGVSLMTVVGAAIGLLAAGFGGLAWRKRLAAARSRS